MVRLWAPSEQSLEVRRPPVPSMAVDPQMNPHCPDQATLKAGPACTSRLVALRLRCRAMDPNLQAAWVAVAGTLLGGLVGGGFQAWTNHRALRATRDEASRQREATFKALGLQVREERLMRLWSERRALYAKALEAADRWHRANVDVSGLDLPNSALGKLPLESRTIRHAEALAPEAAEAARSMHEFGRFVLELGLMADAKVVASASALRKTLRDEMTSCITLAKSKPSEYGKAVAELNNAMREELIFTGRGRSESEAVDNRDATREPGGGSD